MNEAAANHFHFCCVEFHSLEVSCQGARKVHVRYCTNEYFACEPALVPHIFMELLITII